MTQIKSLELRIKIKITKKPKYTTRLQKFEKEKQYLNKFEKAIYH